MAVNRGLLQQALTGKSGANAYDSDTSILRNLQSAEDIQASALNSNNFGGGRAGLAGVAAQLGTAAIGAYARSKAERELKDKEQAAQSAFASKYPEFADLASQLSPATREAFALKDLSRQAGFSVETDPAQVKEYNFYTKLSPQDQKNYLNLKRSDPVAAAYAKERAKYDYAGPIEEEKALGKNRGEKTALLESIESKLPELDNTVNQLSELGKRATYTLAGQVTDAALKQSGMPTRDAAVARKEYISKVDNQILPLLRDTFGAQFTENEGKTLRSTLGNPDFTPAEKDAVLRSFISQKRESIKSLRRELGKGGEIEKSTLIDAPNSNNVFQSSNGVKFTIKR